MPAYTVLLGDYNLSLKKIESITWDDGKELRRIITLQDEPTTLNAPRDENRKHHSTGYTENDYDHVSVDEGFKRKARIRVTRVDAVHKYTGGDFDTYRRNVSDHVPIRMTINLNNRG